MPSATCEEKRVNPDAEKLAELLLAAAHPMVDAMPPLLQKVERLMVEITAKMLATLRQAYEESGAPYGDT